MDGQAADPTGWSEQQTLQKARQRKIKVAAAHVHQSKLWLIIIKKITLVQIMIELLVRGKTIYRIYVLFDVDL